MHSRSQISSGPSYSAAPTPYSASLDDYFMTSDHVRPASFSYEDHAGDRVFDAPIAHVYHGANTYGAMFNTALTAAELDECSSLHSGLSGGAQ
jgi:hypothetical protein